MDTPRFARIEAPHEHLHLLYHGGGVVQAVLWLADRMLRARDRRDQRREKLGRFAAPLPGGRHLRPTSQEYS
jgi:hypothetical protein